MKVVRETVVSSHHQETGARLQAAANRGRVCSGFKWLLVACLLLKSAAIQAQSNLVWLISSPGDYIGQGQTYLTENPADFNVSFYESPATIRVYSFGFACSFSGPNGNYLTVGAYPNAVRYPFNGSSPGLDINGNGRGCNTACGSFTVNEIHVDGSGQVDRFWVTFSNSCECFVAPMTGEIRYNSQLAPPILIATRQPTNQVIFSGDSAVVNVSAVGLAPMYYCWYLNGTNFAVTTNGQIIIPNFQAANAGIYGIVVTNALTLTTFSNFVLAITNSGPLIMPQPTNLIGCVDSNVVLAVQAVGSQPMYYQWQFNGANIIDATNAVLSLTNLQFSDEGYYNVVITNAFGSTNSPGVYLNVVDTAEVLNTTDLAWNSFGDASWFAQTTVTYDGVAAMQSGSISAGQESILQATIIGPGTLTFWWNVSSEQYNNYLSFSVNGIEQCRISGVIFIYYGWNQQSVYLGAGPQALQWDYVKTDSGLSISELDSGWLDEVNFTPGGTAPFVTLEMSSQVVLLGSNATLNAAASGTPPLYYQWQLNGANVDGATNTSLTWTNVQYTNEGSYSLVISNAFGVTNTAAAFLNVVDFTEAVSATNLVWSSGGNMPWFPETSMTHDGVAALQSGHIAGNQQSTLQTTVNGPGTLSFWWQVSSQTNNDYVNFSLDGLEQSRISGTVGWQQQTYYLVSGAHTLVWNYSKNASVNAGSDAAWLDQVSYTPNASPPFIISNPASVIVPWSSNAVFSVVAQGTPPLSYQWQFNGTNINGATNATLTLYAITLTNEGAYSVLISNVYGTATSSNATLTLLRDLVVAWGYNFYGQTNVPSNLTNVIAISAGNGVEMALKGDGTVAVWGGNFSGQLNIPTGLSNVVAISTESDHCLALKGDGTVVAWGNNANHQTNVPAGLSNVVMVAAGGYHSLALKNDGKIVAWGYNSYGQTNVPTGLTNVSAISAGNYFSMALKSNSTVSVWGDAFWGQANIPVGLSNVVSIAAGGNHCLALKNNGTVAAWGDDGWNQSDVPAGLTNVIAVAAGTDSSLALKNDGTVVTWGMNIYGSTNVPNILNHVAAIASGNHHSMARIEDGPPVVAPQPANQTNYAGYNAVFRVNVTGLHPLSFQWLLNGTNVPNATNNTIVVTNIQPAGSCFYSLSISNALGVIVSSNAILVVLTNPPTLTLQPVSQTVMGGSSVTFTAAVGPGPIPVTYQWQFNGTNISSATNLILALTNVRGTNQGNYSIIVNNPYGNVASSNAYLTVMDLPVALNTPDWTWTSGGGMFGGAAWFAQTNSTHDGFQAAQSGSVNNNQSSILQTTVTGPGTLIFWWNFSPLTTPYANRLSFSSSQGNNSVIINSTTNWEQKTFYLGAGQQTLTWTYSRYLVVSGQSTGLVDQVSFTPGGTPPTITYMSSNAYVRANSSAAFLVSGYGTPPLTYQWQVNGTNLLNQTNTFLSLTGVQPTNSGIYSVIITNAYGAIVTNATLWVGQFALSTSPTNLSLSTNGLQLQLDGVLTTNPVVILGSTDLVNWLPIYTNPATTGSVWFIDATATNLPARFYRAQE